MKTIVIIKPGIVNLHTAFECMVLIYKYLQENYDIKIRIVKSEHDTYDDSSIDFTVLPEYASKNIPYTPWARLPFISEGKLFKSLENADGIITVDPSVYPYGHKVIKYAIKNNIPVWFDTSLTHLNNEGGMIWKLFWRGMVGRSLEQVSGVFATVPKCLERFNDLGVLKDDVSEKFHFIGHPVDTEIFKPISKPKGESEKIKVIVVSRLVPEKGHLYILEAITPLIKEFKDINLRFVGDGSLKAILKRELQARNIEDRVTIIDKLDHDDIAVELGNSDIYISHALDTNNWEEYFGAANLEAMSCGLACIVSNVGGISYVLRGEGIVEFTAPRDIAELRSKLKVLIQSAELRNKMGLRAREYVINNYCLELVSKKIYSVLAEKLDYK